MGHYRRSVVASFWIDGGVAIGQTVTLDPDAARHIRVLRLAPGDRVGLTDGAGQIAACTLIAHDRSIARVRVESVSTVPRPHPIHLLVPVADRDRLLWLAEKCGELQATSWRAVQWRRSASVSSRGAGPAFRARVAARMTAALTQSGGAWLPEIHDPAPLADVLSTLPPALRIVLEPEGAPLLGLLGGRLAQPVAIAVGPEGGMEPEELAALAAAGFVRASLGDTILRFETAAVAALAIVRSVLWATVDGLPPRDLVFQERDHGE